MKTVKGYIRRKTMLYLTGVEYGDYTMNHVLGCAHGCKYPCYAFLLKRRFGQVESYENWLEPYLVENTLDLLEKEIPRLKDKIKSVQLCFTTDPFMFGYDEIGDMSLKAIEKLNANGIKCCVLTKGLLPIKLAELSKENEYGVTIVSLDESYRRIIEPHAAKYEARIEALKALHDKGCKTWVSIEPYPTPNIIKQDIGEILERVKFTNRIIFGRTNYNQIVTHYSDAPKFYNDCVYKVINFCTTHNINYHIKTKTFTG